MVISLVFCTFLFWAVDLNYIQDNKNLIRIFSICKCERLVNPIHFPIVYRVLTNFNQVFSFGPSFQSHCGDFPHTHPQPKVQKKIIEFPCKCKICAHKPPHTNANAHNGFIMRMDFI